MDRFLHGTELITEKMTSWAESFMLLVPNMVLSALVLFLFFLIARYARKLTRKGLSRVVDSQALVSLTATIAQFVVVIAGFLIALNLLNLEKTVTSVLAGAGVIGLALGFAFQETAANFISGVFIAARNPIRIGDIVTVNGGEMGVVDQINLRATVVKTFQGQNLLVPNKDVYQNVIKNYSTGSRRIDLQCGISYGDDLSKVEKIAVEAIESLGITKEGEKVQLFYEGFGDSSINFVLHFWIDYPEHPSYLQARHRAIMALKKAFDQNEITIPFPIRTLDFGIKGGKALSSEVKSLSLMKSE